MIVWILAEIYFNQITRAIQQLSAFRTQVTKVQPFPEGTVFFSDGVNRLKSRLVIHPGVIEIDHNIIRIVFRVE